MPWERETFITEKLTTSAFPFFVILPTRHLCSLHTILLLFSVHRISWTKTCGVISRKRHCEDTAGSSQNSFFPVK